MVFFLNKKKILPNIIKFLLSKFYTIITNPHPSTLMYIIFPKKKKKQVSLSDLGGRRSNLVSAVERRSA